MLQFCSPGFIKEFINNMIILSIFILEGIGRSYVVFLFEQLKLPNSPIVLDDEQKSWIASAFGFLAPIGCLLSGTLMDFFGRKRYFFMMNIPFILSWAIICYSRNYETLFLGMAAQGLGLGMTFCASAYVSEISSTRNRGTFLGLVEVWYTLGMVICNVSLYFMSWNIAAMMYCAYAIICILLATQLIESPSWLYCKGKKEESIKTLCLLRCSHQDEIANEIKDLEKAQENVIKFSPLEMIKNILKGWKPLMICLIVKFFLQNSGYIIMRGYTITVFEGLHLPFDSSEFAIFYSIAGFLGSITAGFFMHMMNRKTLLFVSAFIMGICMTVIGLYAKISYFRKDIIIQLIPLAFYLNIFSCSFGADPITFCIGDEIFPNETRGILNGIYGALDNFYISVTYKFFPTILNNFGVGFVICTFAFFSFLAAAYAVFILPETRGKTLNEVQEEYFKKKETNVEITKPQEA